jgi:hypothetical protein
MRVQHVFVDIGLAIGEWDDAGIRATRGGLANGIERAQPFEAFSSMGLLLQSLRLPNSAGSRAQAVFRRAILTP